MAPFDSSSNSMILYPLPPPLSYRVQSDTLNPLKLGFFRNQAHIHMETHQCVSLFIMWALISKFCACGGPKIIFWDYSFVFCAWSVSRSCLLVVVPVTTNVRWAYVTLLRPEKSLVSTDWWWVQTDGNARAHLTKSGCSVQMHHGAYKLFQVCVFMLFVTLFCDFKSFKFENFIL